MLLRTSLRQAARLALAACLMLAGCGNDCSGSCGATGGPINVLGVKPLPIAPSY